METRANPFYELYDRLYYAAAAGTAVISEDFRLKRAVEAFEPLAQKNKVFARLYSMCKALLTSENAPSAIADCIALANALAVTQGVFSDSSETHPSVYGSFKTHNITYLQLNELKDVIAKAKNSTKPFPEELSKYADDPRLVSCYLKYADNNSENYGRLSLIFEKACGRALIEPLFMSINMNDPKATGRQIEFISRIVGADENELYKSLAFNEKAPQGVRVYSIRAMSLSAENADLLTELYRTSKGSVNIAAAEAIGVISPPQGEEIFVKLAEKFKAAYTDAFAAAKYPVCSRYAREALNKWMKEKPGHEFPVKIGCILCGKTDVYDCFDRMAQKGKEFGGYAQLLERILLADMTKYGDADYFEMTDQLYRKYPDLMFFTKLVSDILRKGDSAFDLPNDIIDRYIGEFGSLLDNITAEDDGYHLTMWKFEGAPRLKDTVLFERLPDKLLKILAETPYKTKDRNDKRNYSLLSFVRKCVPADTERVTNAALTFALDSFAKEPGLEAMYLLEENDRLPRGAVTDHIMYYITKFGRIRYYTYTAMYSQFKDPERVPAELKEAAERINNMQNKLGKQEINDSLKEINKALELIELQRRSK